MPISRTLSMFVSLSSKERKELNIVIQNKKKISLQKLHKVVLSEKKRNKIETKEDLFPLVLGYKYSKSKDFLLRNEIRLYNTELKKIISKTHFENSESMQNAAFTNELESRQIDEILGNEINKRINESESKYDFEKLDFFLQKSITLKKKNLKYSSSTFMELKELLNKSLNNKLLRLGEEVSEVALNIAYAERVLFQLTQKQEFTKIYDDENLFSEIFSKNLAYLNCLKTKAYKTNAVEKIKVSQKIIQFLDVTKYQKIDLVKERISVLQSIATEYLLMGEYSKANDYFALCFENKEAMNENFFSGVSLNYISSLVKALDFEKASVFIIENKLNTSSKLQKRILPMVVMSFILSDKIEEAEKLMPLQFDKQDLDFYHYLRVLQCIIFFENNLLELAENEAENLKRHLESFKEKSNELDNEISLLLIDFIKSEFNYVEPKKTEKHNKLKEDLLRFSEQNKKFDSDGLVLLWLKKKLLIE